MKILELRFKKLNSLYGEWVIDFTDPEYISNGIFALTSLTGADKSTILDALCLALYGATPRLGKITKSGNEIMSRQTGECYAEVYLEILRRVHERQRDEREKLNILNCKYLQTHKLKLSRLPGSSLSGPGCTKVGGQANG